MNINFTAINPGTGDPVPVFGKDTADLVDIHFPFPSFTT